MVSTGTVVTPQLLMVSGLGPEDELKEHNIPVVRNLPLAGKNLLDVHLFCFPLNVTEAVV
jgi:choline dehydrogenase